MRILGRVRAYSVMHTALTSAADPDPNPDPSDPHAFGPPGSGSGSISQRYASGARVRILLSISKNSKKNLDSYCFVTSF